jgi:hypothetical protein
MRRFPWVVVLLAAPAAAQIPAGSEFRANTYTTGAQREPAVAADANGNFVVMWSSAGQDGNGYGIFGQRFSWTGAARGAEFQVNTTTFGLQQHVDVASDAAGNFVAAWDGYEVRARRFDADGAPLGADFVVNTYTTGSQTTPSVASTPDGRFVVAWSSQSGDGAASAVFAQRFDASGVPQGPEFRVNTYTTGAQVSPAVAIDRVGNFVVAWTSNPQDGSLAGIFGQRFDAAGTAQGTEFRVNTHTTGYQSSPAAAMDADGNFVIAWADGDDYDGSDVGVFARRYDSAGSPLLEFLVNTYTTAYQQEPAIASAAGGGFTIVWQSPHDGSPRGVFGQIFQPTTFPIGGEFRSTPTPRPTRSPPRSPRTRTET